MRDVYVERNATTDLGTPSDFHADGYKASMLELPWRQNHPQRSCIPPGDYLCQWGMSNHFKIELYHVYGVMGRDGILIHAANWAGDVDKGMQSQLLGCLAPGIAYGDVTINGITQWGILKSKVALQAFEDLLMQQDFRLHVKWKDGAEPAL